MIPIIPHPTNTKPPTPSDPSPSYKTQSSFSTKCIHHIGITSMSPYPNNLTKLYAALRQTLSANTFPLRILSEQQRLHTILKLLASELEPLIEQDSEKEAKEELLDGVIRELRLVWPSTSPSQRVNDDGPTSSSPEFTKHLQLAQSPRKPVTLDSFSGLTPVKTKQPMDTRITDEEEDWMTSISDSSATAQQRVDDKGEALDPEVDASQKSGYDYGEGGASTQ